MRRTGAALFVLAVMAGPAGAASQVLGTGLARQCFLAAQSGHASATALKGCDAALSELALTREERAATLVNRGILRLLRREAELALADFDAALLSAPDLGEASVNRGAALILLDRPEAAIAAIDLGLANGAQDPHEAYFNRAIAREALGDLAGAYRDYREAQALKPDWTLPAEELARFSVARQ